MYRTENMTVDEQTVSPDGSSSTERKSFSERNHSVQVREIRMTFRVWARETLNLFHINNKNETWYMYGLFLLYVIMFIDSRGGGGSDTRASPPLR